MAEPRYGGAYTPPEAEPEDIKPKLEAMCEPKCVAAKEAYEACEVRIEEKVRFRS